MEKRIIEAIREVILVLRKENNFEPIVKDQIFEVLEKRCTVIYYPFENEKNRGFHIKKLVKDELVDFVYINTAKTIEQQVFTAAHEMGHVWNVYQQVIEKIDDSEIQLDVNDSEEEEKVVDRFAAELLMPVELFKEKTNLYITEAGFGGRISVKSFLKMIAKLMDDFMSPFNAVRKRLREINVIDEKAEEYLRVNQIELEDIVNQLKKDENTLINGNTNIKMISGLRGLIDEASNLTDVDQSLIEKIRSDFDLGNIQLSDQISINILKEI